ncbi:hypothetical protein [Chryseobacterium sp.]|uniref:hypothetical protein n=1 Tax=Chryseobacterium sp. TaxID=1871047 RepID=UPI0025C4AD75|nr:hypothetical protein [Chryseobacterium sp.]
MKYNKHIITENETLKSIAAFYGLAEEELKLFHNNHCEVKDMILIGLTSQKELFIPRTAVADKNKLVPLGHGNKLKFQPENSFLKYGVIITIENVNHKNELKFETSVRWLKSENLLHFFEIDRTSRLYLNEEEVNEMADLLAYKASKVLYPLQVSVNQEGKLNAIENLTLFNKRWNGIKEEIYKEFEGEIVDEYCQKIENTLAEPEILTVLLKNDYFLRTMFFGVYQSFGKNYKTTGTESFPVINNPIEPHYEISLEIDPLKDEYDLISIEGNGILYDERTVNDFINGALFPVLINEDPVFNENGSFRIQYYLNGESVLPESLYLESDIMLQERKKVAVVISALQEETE